MSVRFKRLIAFVIDWNITLLPFVFIFSFLTAFLRQGTAVNPLIVLLCFFAFIFAFGMVVLRDVISKGRSLGKRIFGLYVYDKSSLEKANVRQRCIRNIFIFLLFFDGILLLVTGQTIGDRVAGTLVASPQEAELHTGEIRSNIPVSKKQKIKITILIITKKVLTAKS